jgi:hypothetical protein
MRLALNVQLIQMAHVACASVILVPVFALRLTGPEVL